MVESRLSECRQAGCKSALINQAALIRKRAMFGALTRFAEALGLAFRLRQKQPRLWRGSKAAALAVNLLSVSLLLVARVATATPTPEGIAFFESKIRPVLVEHCYQCHSAAAFRDGKLKAELFVDSRAGMEKGGESGSAIVPGKKAESLLLSAIEYDRFEMPPDGKLPDSVIADFRSWIEMNAPDPRDEPLAESRQRAIDVEAGRQHWSYRRLGSTPLPNVKKSDWCSSDIDRFVLATLENAGIEPNGPAPRETLARRVFLDLTGLPPSPGELQLFLSDAAPDAYEKLVDRLLASLRYGERWARHWLDAVRFAESGGYEFDNNRLGAHHYRDFVIKAINDNMPYDEFLRLQVAGDVLRPGDYAAVSASGFFVAGPYPGQLTVKTTEPIRYDQLDDMIASLGSSMLGMTIGCARCHDHKYDAITHRDYYAMIACLQNTVHTTVKVDPNPIATNLLRAEWEAKRMAVLSALNAGPTEELHQTLKAIDAKEPKPALVEIYSTGGGGGDVFVLARGDVSRKQEKAQAGFVRAALTADAVEAELMTGADGKPVPHPRVALARFLTDTESGAGPLSARVAVNRLWHHHFGRGIVATPNDLGTQGERPTHPELLEWLAGKLVESHWQLKSIHKLIVMSATYRQSGVVNTASRIKDPDNLLLWHRQPVRLEGEAIRDSLLSLAGTLDTTMYGQGTLDAASKRRSVYLTVKRSEPVAFLQEFDQPEPIQSIGARGAATVPTQALVMMNSPLVRLAAEGLAKRAREAIGGSGSPAIAYALSAAVSRVPRPEELEKLTALLSTREQEAGNDQGHRERALIDICQLILCLNEFIYID